MIRSLLKIALVAAIWRWLQPRWKPLGTLMAVIVITSILHSEYIEYVEISNIRDSLILSYLLKWAIFLGSLSLYILIFELKLKKKEQTNTQSSEDKLKDNVDDGFNFIRRKKVLNVPRQHLWNRYSTGLGGVKFSV